MAINFHFFGNNFYNFFFICVCKLPETNLNKNLQSIDNYVFIKNYKTLISSKEFWTYVIPGSLSYCNIFVFISSSSIILIDILSIQTKFYGYCFALGVSGYLTGTIICRILLKSSSSKKVLKIGTSCSLIGGIFFFITSFSGIWHWIVLVISMFIIMMSHGINFPISQSGAINPFPKLAGTASGLMGFIFMLSAFFAGIIIGVSYNKTLYPIAFISLTICFLNFISVRFFFK